MPLSPLVAQLVTGRTDWGGEPARVSESDRGDVGQADYFVNTADPERARTASGLPRRGDRWSPDRPDLVVVGIDPPVFIGGADDSVTGVGGWTGFRFRYETPGATGRVELKKTDGSTDYTEITWEETNVRQYYDWRVETGGPGAPTLRIDNGRGADHRVLSVVAVVHRFRAWSPTPIGLVLDAAAAPINSVELRLPPEKGGTDPIVVDPLLAMFLGIERRPVDAVNRRKGLEWVFRIALQKKPTFGAADTSPYDLLWQQEDKQGFPVASVIAQLYKRSDYRTLINA